VTDPAPPRSAAAPSPATPNRTPEQIRASIEANRAELGVAVERLRAQATELADWRGHVRRHRTEILIGAAVAGFVLGGGIAALVGRLRRR
jgi:Protein of unknown function (DUF3618)